MPITPYVRPQETITQILRATPAPSVNRRNPLVLGPEYLLGNYESTNRYEQSFAGLTGTLDYTYNDADGIAVGIDTDTHTVDTASVLINAEDLEVRVSAQSSAVAAKRGATSTTLVQNTGLVFFTGPVGELAGNLNDRAVRVGDILYVTADAVVYRRTVVGFTAGNDGKATAILLNGAVPGDPDDAVTFYVTSKYTGPLNADVLTSGSFADIVAGATEVDYEQFTFQKAVFGVPNTGVNCAAVRPTGSAARLSVYFRAIRVVSELDGVITINSLSDLAQLGPLHMDNWLAYGAYWAFKGNQSMKTYVLRTGGDTVEDFTAALDKIKSTDYYYAVTPMTDDEDVKDLVAAHCDEMSNKYNRNFRRCYVGTDSPAGAVFWGIKDDGSLRVGVVTDDRLVMDDGDWPVSNFLTDLSVGDTITLGATITGDAINDDGESVIIKRIISSYEVEFTTTPATDGSLTVVGTRKDSAANVVKFFQERSIGSRRCVNVWSDNPVTFGSAGSTRVPMKFVAAEIAGLRCALLPQQGLTMTEVLSIDTAPGMYTRFTPEQLDVIASNGVFVVTQEIEGGEVFIRHQLTTKTDAGALAYEDNVGVIVDEFSYRVKDAFRQYLGRRNVTQETLAEIAAKLKELAIAATQETLANREIGPMVLRFFDENDKEGDVTVRVDGNLADHIVTYVRLRVPLPINAIDHYIDVETSVEL